ncbi:hypothetical protein J1N35_043194 [Gossypium stocksii]|uniref:Transmembrane protein n=1 Tax=Gossypium stocksii TaxID=47602 RepID=A0A9D3U718_9ROSI|nr:hypothetical protein J1N35_043194 [Gossypium stocksii]
MDTQTSQPDEQKSQPDKQSSSAAAPLVSTSCRKKKNEEATFLEDLKDHIDEFINASMEEHKTCFKKTIQKVLSLIFRAIVFSLSCASFWVIYIYVMLILLS